MRLITFASGKQITTKLSNDEMLKRMRRLYILRVITEQHETENAVSICKKAVNAYDKKDNFTGIIKLTFLEKDFLRYLLENDYINEEEKEVINFYI